MKGRHPPASIEKGKETLIAWASHTRCGTEVGNGQLSTAKAQEKQLDLRGRAIYVEEKIGK